MCRRIVLFVSVVDPRSLGIISASHVISKQPKNVLDGFIVKLQI